MTIFRDEHGVWTQPGRSAGTGSRTTRHPASVPPMGNEGMTFESGKRCEVTAVVAVTSSRGDLFEFEARGEPIVVRWLD